MTGTKRVGTEGVGEPGTIDIHIKINYVLYY